MEKKTYYSTKSLYLLLIKPPPGCYLKQYCCKICLHNKKRNKMLNVTAVTETVVTNKIHKYEILR